MTPTRLRECLDLIGWSQRALADTLGLHETRVRRWATGRYPVPDNVAAWLERLAKAHAAHPLPDGWSGEKRPAA
jgi:ribosome-binding protein aMBF1 (putative translation factor)